MVPNFQGVERSGFQAKLKSKLKGLFLRMNLFFVFISERGGKQGKPAPKTPKRNHFRCQHVDCKKNGEKYGVIF